MFKNLIMVIFLSLVSTVSHAKSHGRHHGSHHVRHHSHSNASWYGPGFHGHRTASGQRFNMFALTAAHKTLPLGSKVKVTNNNTAESVVVTINDRGPFVRGRIIDLSYAAARAIGLNGVGNVSLKVIN